MGKKEKLKTEHLCLHEFEAMQKRKIIDTVFDM